MAVDVIREKVDLIRRKKSPIQDECIEKYLAEKNLNLTATLDAEAAYRDADFVVIAAPTNYDAKKNFFDTSAAVGQSGRCHGDQIHYTGGVYRERPKKI